MGESMAARNGKDWIYPKYKEPGLGLERRKVQTIRSTGAVYMYGPELDVVDTPEFQRLGAIKQLGTSDFVFRGAVHTRFEHSLGALQKAQQIIDAVNANPDSSKQIDARGVRLARLGTLLHDLTHVPFGHTLEDELGLLKRHDENRPRMQALLIQSRVGDILRNALAEEEYQLLLHVLDAVQPQEDDANKSKDMRMADALGEYAYVADIVANTVCADVLDYIVRDLTACGMPVAIGERFLDYFVVTPASAKTIPDPANRNRMALRLDKRGMPRPDVESEIIKLLTYRYELAERVFFHHAKNAASVMIGRAVMELGLASEDSNFHFVGDDVLLAVLANPDIARHLEPRLTITGDKARKSAAEDLGRALVHSRELYKLAYLGVDDDDVNRRAPDIFARWGGSQVAARRELEDQLADKAGVAHGRVLLHLPTPDMMSKLAKVKVLLDGDTVTTFEEWEARHSGRVQALNDAHRRLWRVAVYLHPDDAADEDKKQLVTSAAADVFKLPSRYVQADIDEPYLATVFDLFVDEHGWPAGQRRALIRDASKAAAAADAPQTLEAAIGIIDSVARTDAHGARDPQTKLPATE
jgi:HD superfamily phosphohydrolase